MLQKPAKDRPAMSMKGPLPVDVLVGQNIHICRLQRDMSQSELGNRIGVTFQQVQKYEKGANRVGASRLSQIADVLEVPLSTLFEGSAQVSHTPPEHAPRSLLAKPHALRLLKSFHNIPDARTRMAVLRLVEQLASTRGRG